MASQGGLVVAASNKRPAPPVVVPPLPIPTPVKAWYELELKQKPLLRFWEKSTVSGINDNPKVESIEMIHLHLKDLTANAPLEVYCYLWQMKDIDAVLTQLTGDTFLDVLDNMCTGRTHKKGNDIKPKNNEICSYHTLGRSLPFSPDCHGKLEECAVVTMLKCLKRYIRSIHYRSLSIEEKYTKGSTTLPSEKYVNSCTPEQVLPLVNFVNWTNHLFIDLYNGQTAFAMYKEAKKKKREQEHKGGENASATVTLDPPLAKPAAPSSTPPTKSVPKNPPVEVLRVWDQGLGCYVEVTEKSPTVDNNVNKK